MANTLKFKRGLVATIPTAALGEPLFTTDTFDLYIGNGTGNTRFQKYIASGATTQILRGDGSLYTFPLNISSPSNGQVLKYNGTSWVNDSDAGITGSGSAGQVAYFTGATTQTGSNNLFWDATNNRLGIGLNNPAQKLHIIGSILNTTGYVLNRSDNYGFFTGASDDLGFYHDGTNSLISNATGDLIFSNPSQRARITSGGNFIINNASTDNGLRFQVTGDGYFSGSVGIGTSSPVAALQIGNGYTTSVYDGFRNTNSPNFLMAYDASDVYHRILGGLYNTASTINVDLALPITKNLGTAGSGFRITSGVGTNVVAENGYLAFSSLTGQAGETFLSSERMRLTSNGNLGLGVTPSAWASTRAIQIGLSGSIANRSGGNGFYMSSNLYFSADPSNTAANGVYLNSDFATTYLQANGAHRWYNAPSGTAGNAISFTQAMTLFATGNLGIGVTSDATYRLDVNGTMRVSGIATFGSQVHVPNSSNGTLAGYYFDYNTSQANSRTWRLVNDYAVYGDFQLQQSTTQTGSTFATILNILPTGAATFSSSVTAASFIPSSSTIPTNGMYLSATNTLAFATASGNKLTISSTGLATFSDSARFSNLKGCIFVQTGGSLLGSISMDSSNQVTIDNNGFFGLSVGSNYTMTGGNLGIGHSSFGTSATRTISVVNGTAPSTSPTDSFQIYSNDVVAGNAAPHIRTENGAIIKLYQETTAVGNSTISVGGGNAVLDDTEFDGYTLRQIVKALRNQGILQ